MCAIDSMDRVVLVSYRSRNRLPIQLFISNDILFEILNVFNLFLQIISAVYLHESQAAPKPLGLIKGKIALAKTKLALVKTKIAIAKAPHIIATALVAKEVKAKAKIAAAKTKAAVRISISFPSRFRFLNNFHL